MAYLHAYEQDYDEFAKELADDIWDNGPEAALSMELGHTGRHFYKDGYVRDSIARLLGEGVRGAGVFAEDRNEALSFIQAAAGSMAEAIADWQQKGVMEFGGDPRRYR